MNKLWLTLEGFTWKEYLKHLSPFEYCPKVGGCLLLVSIFGSSVSCVCVGVCVYSFFLSLLCSGPLSLCCSETLYWQAWGGCWYCSTLSAVNPGSALHPVWHHKELWRLPTGKQNHRVCVCGQQISTTVLFQGSFYCSAWFDLRSKFLQLLVLWVFFFFLKFFF